MTTPAQPTVTVQWSPTTNPGATPVWQTISGVEGLTVSRGGAYEQRQVQAGQARVSVDNAAGTYTPGATGVDTDRAVQVLVTPPAPYNGTTYPLHTGTADAWDETLDAAGAEYARVDLTTIDAFDSLNAYTLRSTIAAELLADSPLTYLPMSDAAGSTSAGSQVAGVGVAPLVYAGFYGASGNGTAAFGGTALSPSDTSTSLSLAPAFSISGPTGPFGVNTYAGGYLVRPDSGPQPVYWPSGDVTFRCVFAVTNTYGSSACLVSVWDAAANVAFQVIVHPTFIYAFGGNNTDGSAGALAQVNTNAGQDYAAHLLVATYQASTGNVTLSVDGGTPVTATGTGTRRATGTLRWAIGGDAARQQAAGAIQANINDFLPCLVGHTALYGSVLTSTRSQTVYQAHQGFPADTTGTRLGRILSYAGVPSSAQALDAGQSQMGPAQLAGVSALTAAQACADVEQGLFFIAANGNHTFFDRARPLNAASRVTLNTATMPVEADITFAVDRQYLRNDITGSRTNGATQRVVDTASVARHLTRAESVTYNFVDDASVLAAIQWRLLKFAQPQIRAPKVTLRPMESPALWPWALGLDLGDRITIANLPATAPASSLDFTIVNVAVTQATQRQGWSFTFLLAPADTTTWLALDSSAGGLDVDPLAF